MKAETDSYWMQLALEMAREGEGMTRPNPPVGAIVVKNNRVVGEGFHPKAGQPHAEIFALRAAGGNARGATLFVTLEPCCTEGRTPPCTEAIIKSGVSRVVYGCVDPYPAHAGRADAILRKAGVKVTRNILRDECAELIRPFATCLKLKRPFITLKLACTLDGRIADANGCSKWITGAKAREAVQSLRRTADAIMIGADTLRMDNPSLLPRPAHGRSPMRVVVAGSKPLPLRSQVFHDRVAHLTVVFAKSGFKQRRSLEKLGVEVIELSTTNAWLPMRLVVREMAKRNCMHLLCEGGGVLARSLLKNDLVDQLWMFYSPKILGGDARPAVGGNGWRLDTAPDFVITLTEIKGDDVLVVARRK